LRGLQSEGLVQGHTRTRRALGKISPGQPSPSPFPVISPPTHPLKPEVSVVPRLRPPVLCYVEVRGSVLFFREKGSTPTCHYIIVLIAVEEGAEKDASVPPATSRRLYLANLIPFFQVSCDCSRDEACAGAWRRRDFRFETCVGNVIHASIFFDKPLPLFLQIPSTFSEPLNSFQNPSTFSQIPPGTSYLKVSAQVNCKPESHI
jgi:hypothetical protein